MEPKQGDDNNVTIDTYAVVYTDGVDGEVIFEDQVTDNLKDGEKTPAFNNGVDPVREGYVFMGWDPEVKETVVASDAETTDSYTNAIIYTAVWKEEKEEYTYTVNFWNWVEKEGDPNGEYVLVKSEPIVSTEETYVYTLKELSADETISKFDLKKSKEYTYISVDKATKNETSYTCPMFIGWSETESVDHKSDGSYKTSGAYTLSKENNVLNLYAGWKFYYGIQAIYNVYGVNNGNVSMVDYKALNATWSVNQFAPQYANPTRLNMLVNGDVTKNGYNIVGFNRDNRFGHEETHVADDCDYPIGKPIPITISTTETNYNNIVYPVFGTTDVEHRTK